jgi:hypothetical protein
MKAPNITDDKAKIAFTIEMSAPRDNTSISRSHLQANFVHLQWISLTLILAASRTGLTCAHIPLTHQYHAFLNA